jgi:hypothetical protein
LVQRQVHDLEQLMRDRGADGLLSASDDRAVSRTVTNTLFAPNAQKEEK